MRFGHPLMRSAIAQGGPEYERRAAHEALAETLADDPRARSGTASPPRRDRRRARRRARRDARRRALRRGSIVTAAETLGRAAALTGDEAARGARLLDAAELALDIGRDDLVERLLGRRRPARARARRPAAPRLAAADRAPARARARLVRGPPGPDRRARPATRARVAGAADARLPRLVVGRPARAARAHGRARPRAPAGHARGARARHARAGRRRRSTAPRSRAGWNGSSRTSCPSELLRLAGGITGVVGAFDRGVVLGDHAIERLRARGRYGLLAPALVGRAWDGVFAGAWSASLAAAQDATVVARETEQPLWAVAGWPRPRALTGLRGDARRGAGARRRRRGDPAAAAPPTACAR